MLIWLLTLTGALALAETGVELTAEEDWTWELNGVSGFHGTLHPQEDVTGAHLSLSVECGSSDPGEMLFTGLDGERLKIRKQAPEADADLKAGVDFPVEGVWNLPAEAEAPLRWARIRLTVQDAEGREIGRGELEMGERGAADALGAGTPEKTADLILICMLICSAICWGAAVFRHVRLNR